VPASFETPCVSGTESAEGAPTAKAVSGSQNTVTTPSAVSKINVVVTAAEVRSDEAADEVSGEGRAARACVEGDRGGLVVVIVPAGPFRDAAGEGGVDGLAFGDAGIGRNIHTT
jgi:hypothetical protein